MVLGWRSCAGTGRSTTCPTSWFGRAARGAPEPVRGAFAGARRLAGGGGGMKIKVCGVTERAEVELLGRCGVDGAGLWHGVTGGDAELSRSAFARRAADARACDVEPVLVTFAADPGAVDALARACAIKYVQLHAYQLPKVVAALRRPGLHLVKVLHVRGGRCVEERLIDAYERAGVDSFLLDVTSGDGSVGSTGEALPPDRRGAPRGSAHAALLHRRRASPAPLARPTASCSRTPASAASTSAPARATARAASARGGSRRSTRRGAVSAFIDALARASVPVIMELKPRDADGRDLFAGRTPARARRGLRAPRRPVPVGRHRQLVRRRRRAAARGRGAHRRGRSSRRTSSPASARSPPPRRSGPRPCCSRPSCCRGL